MRRRLCLGGDADGDLMGDGVNIAARLEGIAKPGAICLSEDAYRQVKARLDLAVSDLGPTQLKNIAEPNKGVNPEYFARARACFERALALDPLNVDALVGQARIDAEMVGGGLADDRAARLASAEAALNKALSLAPNHPWAHTWMGLVYLHTHRGFQAIAEAERALALDQNLAHAQAGVLAAAKITVGRAEETERHIQEGIRLSPRDSNVYIWAYLGGFAKLGLGEDEAAVAWLRRSIEANRNFPMPQFLLASALAHLDRQEAADAAVRAGLALDPACTIRRQRIIFTSMSDSAIWHAQAERMLDGMHKAGVPEG